MLEKMNVWSFEKSYEDDERKEQEDKTTELSPLTASTEEISNNPNVHVEMSSSALENGGK